MATHAAAGYGAAYGAGVGTAYGSEDEAGAPDAHEGASAAAGAAGGADGCVLAPSAARFGSVAVGGVYSKTLTLTNRGSGLLRFRFHRPNMAHRPVGNSVRLVTDNPGPIARNLSRGITVELLAREPGVLSEVVQVVTPAGTLRVPVSAMVVADNSA
jgi:hypothetical protein